MSPQVAQQLVEKHGSQAAAARAAGMSRTTFCRLLRARTDSPRAAAPTKTAAVPNEVRGIALTGKNIYATRPQDRAKSLLYGLPKGRAFQVAELSREWHMGEETLSKHARQYECLRYVEVEPGQYVKCVMNPETAKQFGG
jgi:hypothetical protein